jgi:phosphoribosyl-ATP pyrophosphohydrolase
MSYRELELEVIRWAEDRKIVPRSTPMAQAIKTLEEVTELIGAIHKGDRAEMVDAYGDVLVTLIVGAALADVDLVSCLESAYTEIKDRKGTLGEDGIFRKEAA